MAKRSLELTSGLLKRETRMGLFTCILSIGTVQSHKKLAMMIFWGHFQHGLFYGSNLPYDSLQTLTLPPTTVAKRGNACLLPSILAGVSLSDP